MGPFSSSRSAEPGSTPRAAKLSFRKPEISPFPDTLDTACRGTHERVPLTSAQILVSLESMKTIALEFVPPNIEDGSQKAVEEAQKIAALADQCGIAGRVKHFMIPGMIDEDDDRPFPMKPKMDPLDLWKAVSPHAPGVKGLCTQVTAFMDRAQLDQRFVQLNDAGFDGVIFVGVPRTMTDGDGNGVAPTDALAEFKHRIDNRGVILIPTREGEQGRFNFKCNRGATFGMTQLLYSDAIVSFLRDFAAQTDHRPEIMLSFGFVPKVEGRLNLINWLIKDPGNPQVKDEQAFVSKLAEMSFPEKKRALLDLYKRVVDGAGELGFPLGVHYETPYGFSKPAFETLSEMLDYWAPDC